MVVADLDELKEAHEDLYDGYEELVGGLRPDDWDRPTGCPGWSVRDILAHVAGVEAILSGGAEPEHDLPVDLPHVKNDVGRYMEVHVDARRGVATDDLAAELREVLARRREQVAAVADLGEELPSVMGATAPAAPMLTIRVFDLWMHEQDLRRALDRPGHRAGPAVDVCLRRIGKGLASQLPERVGDDAGVVVIEVHGETPHTLTVDLRAGAVREHPPAGADVTVRLDLDAFASLVGGRDDAPSPEELDFDGDPELGRRVAGAMAVTP